MIHCPRCQAELPQDARFCNKCGFNQTSAHKVSVLERMGQQTPPPTPGSQMPQEQRPLAPGQPFPGGKLPATPQPGKTAQRGPYDTIAQLSPADAPQSQGKRLSLRERYLAEQAAASQGRVPSQPLPQPAQPGQPAEKQEGQGRTRLSHFLDKNVPASAQPQARPATNDDQGWIEPEQRYRQQQVIRTSTPRPPMPVGQPQPIVRTSTPSAPPAARGPVPPVPQPVMPPQPQRGYSLDTLIQQDLILSNASRYALDRWRRGWWQRQHSEAAPAVGVSRGQAVVPEPLMRMQHSIARMRAILIPKKKDATPLRQLFQARLGLITMIMIALIVILIIYNLFGLPI